MKNAIAKDFRMGSMIRFALPTIVMMVFTSMYSMVDGVFVSRFVSVDALSAINIVYPLINIVLGVSIMLATGGSAIIAKKLGEKREQEARSDLTLLTASGIVFGLGFTAVCLIFMDPILTFLGADAQLMTYCKDYITLLALFVPAGVLQLLFQTFFVTAGKPTLGLILTVLSGLTNVVLDYVFIVPMDLGMRGAALGTGCSYVIVAVTGFLFFCSKKHSLYFGRLHFHLKTLLQACANGSSEMVSNLSGAVIIFLFNQVMMKMLGSAGVASITIVLYSQFFFTAAYLGFAQGVAPIISFNYGSQNTDRLKRVFKYCCTFIGISSALMVAASILLADPIVSIFAQHSNETAALATHGFRLFSISYLFAGMNIFASSLFTALSNGKVSAAISFLRTFGLIVPGILLLPSIMEVDGVWLATPIAEAAAALISLFFIVKGKKRYHY